jgi:hypothetical protein
MLYWEIIAVCSEVHINTLCRQNVELLNVKLGGTCSDLAYKGLNLYYSNQSVNGK